MAEKENIIIESGDRDQPFKYAIGMYGSMFFRELRDRRVFVGVKCPRCKKVYIPPRRVCGDCYVHDFALRVYRSGNR